MFKKIATASFIVAFLVFATLHFTYRYDEELFLDFWNYRISSDERE